MSQGKMQAIKSFRLTNVIRCLWLTVTICTLNWWYFKCSAPIQSRATLPTFPLSSGLSSHCHQLCNSSTSSLRSFLDLMLWPIVAGMMTKTPLVRHKTTHLDHPSRPKPTPKPTNLGLPYAFPWMPQMPSVTFWFFGLEAVMMDLN